MCKKQVSDGLREGKRENTLRTDVHCSFEANIL